MSDRPVIAVVQPHLGLLVPQLSQHYDMIALWEEKDPPRLAEVSALIMAGEFRLPPELVERMPKLMAAMIQPAAMMISGRRQAGIATEGVGDISQFLGTSSVL